MTTPHAPPRIAIIGAGPAGLSAAWFLQRNGYRDIRVFEKLDRVGGKCLTFTCDDRPFDMAAHEMLAGYGDVMDIANALNVPTVGYQAVLVYDRGSRRYMDMLTACQAGGHNRLDIIWASLRYTWMLLTRYRRVSQPGSGFVDTPPELLQPLTSWLKEQRLEALRETVSFVMKVQGFGRLDQLAAAYFVKFQGLRNWLSNVLHVAGLIQSWPRVFRHGFQSLWTAVAQRVDVTLGAEITAIRRRTKPDGNVIKVEIELRDGTREEFDEMILACPLDPRTVSELGLDVGPEEQRLLDKVQYVEFVTTACRVEGVPAGVVGSIPLPAILDYTGYIKIHDDRDLAIFFNLAHSEDYDPAEIVEKIRAQLAALPPYQGVAPALVAEHSQQGWRYFPHVGLTDFAAGFYDQLESLQGFRHTFYAGSLLAFETVGNTVAYSRGLVNRYFPPVRQ